MMKTPIKCFKLKRKKGNLNGVKKMDTSWRQKGEENTWNGEEGKENKTARESGCCFQFHFHFNPLEG